MQFKIHRSGETEIAELLGEEASIHKAEDGLDLVGNLWYQGVDRVMLLQQQLNPEFFDLKTGMAGEILQKFSTYRMQMAIVGDFNHLESKSLRDFIFESNKSGRIHFVASREEAIERLSKAV